MTWLYTLVGTNNRCVTVSNSSTSATSMVRHQDRALVTNQIATPVDATTNDADSDWWLKITKNSSSEHSQRNRNCASDQRGRCATNGARRIRVPASWIGSDGTLEPNIAEKNRMTDLPCHALLSRWRIDHHSR